MSDKATVLNLDVSAEEARALHRVVRAMHDGHCPKCRTLGTAESFQEPPGGHSCPFCGFEITHQEEIDALAAFHPYLAKSVEVFEKWREVRRDGPPETENPVAWLHTLDNTEGIEGNHPLQKLSFSHESPFGTPETDHSEEFTVTKIPLYAEPFDV